MKLIALIVTNDNVENARNVVQMLTQHLTEQGILPLTFVAFYR